MTLEEYIKSQLEQMAERDDNFKSRYEDKEKSFKECLSYIYEQAHEQAKGGNCVAIQSEDIAKWATHYYQEKDVKPKTNLAGSVKTSAAPAAKPVAEQPKAQAVAMAAKPKTKEKRASKQPVAQELDLFGGF